MNIRLRRWPWADLGLFLWVALAAATLVTVGVGPQRYGDGYFHEEAKSWARAIRTGDWSAAGPFEHAPGPSLYYAIPYAALYPSSDTTLWKAATVWNLAWTAAGFVLVARSSRHLGGAAASRAARLLLLVSPMPVYYSLGVLAETPAFFGASLAAFAWVRYATSADRRGKAAGLGVLGLTTLVLCRPNALLVYPLVAGCLFWLWRMRRERDFAVMGALVSSALAAGFLLVGNEVWWHAGNRSAKQNFLTHVLVQGAYQYRTELWDWRRWQKAARAGSEDYKRYVEARVALDREARETGRPLPQIEFEWWRRMVQGDPLLWLRSGVVKGMAANVYILSASDHSSSGRGLALLGAQVILNAANLIVLVTATWWFLRRTEQFPSYGPLLTPWVALQLFTMLTYAEPRYLFPAFGPTLIVAAASLGGMSVRGDSTCAPAC